jgi:hypothetical protein
LKIIDKMPKPPKGKRPQGESLNIVFGEPERSMYVAKKPEASLQVTKPSEPSPFDHFEE